MLAGISTDYYLRLERGRDRHPSVQVLESLARVLQLDDEHLDHLLSLAAEAPRRRRRRPRSDDVPRGVSSLLDSLVQPAYVENRYFDVLASNRLARALSPRLQTGRNQLRDLFLDPAEHALYPDWTAMTECLVAGLRQAVGTDVDDPRFIDLTGELSLASSRFAGLWARHEVRTRYSTSIRFDHPQVGPLMLHREQLRVSGAEGLTLVMYHPEPTSDDAEKLGLLASVNLEPLDRATPREDEETLA